MRILSVFLTLLLLVSSGISQSIEETSEKDNDPRIYPDEILDETSDWKSVEGNPPYPWFILSVKKDNETEVRV